ncbi:MAG: fluoride efflux transporter CrcB [Chloroflexi bacterium]|nr:fluoride efflux transporter CrcB [Chloroflexota bacterium]
MAVILFVGAGGFLGAILRFLIGGWVQNLQGQPAFPYGTTTVNVLGCLILGVIGGLVEGRQLFNPEVRAFLMVGLLGGFTTFSTFGYETMQLARDGEVMAALANVTLQVGLGLAAVWIGFGVARAA